MNKRTVGWNNPGHFLNHKQSQQWGLFHHGGLLVEIHVIPWGGGLKCMAIWRQGGALQHAYFTAGRDTDTFRFNRIQLEVVSTVLEEIGVAIPEPGLPETLMRAMGYTLAAPKGGVWPDMAEPAPWWEQAGRAAPAEGELQEDGSGCPHGNEEWRECEDCCMSGAVVVVQQGPQGPEAESRTP